MGDLGGPQLFANNAQHIFADLSFLPHTFSSPDFLPRQNSFGFSPGTSPAPSDVKNEGADSFFDSQNRSLPTSQSAFLAPNDFRYNAPLKNASYHPASPLSVHQPSRLHIPSATSKQEHGQLTPPSETTPTKDSPPTEALQDLAKSPIEPRNAAATRKRRSTQPSRATAPTSQFTNTPRRRKKAARKQSSAASSGDGDDRRSQFLERNRVAASKCRQKKKEWTSNLEQRARELQASKTSLALLVSSLREELLYLKGEALRHTTCDCNSVREYLARHAEASFPRNHIDYASSPHSGSNISFKAIDLDASVIHDSPNSSALLDYQDLPELNTFGLIPD